MKIIESVKIIADTDEELKGKIAEYKSKGYKLTCQQDTIAWLEKYSGEGWG